MRFHGLATPRDIMEAKMLRTFRNKLISVEQATSIIENYKDGSFAMSVMGMLLYTNGDNLRGKSTRYPNGMVYHDGSAFFGVGCFAKEGGGKSHIVITSPQGENAIKMVENFIQEVRDRGITNQSIYIRHLYPKEYKKFLARGAESIDTDPWHPEAPEEDETFPNRVFDLDNILSFSSAGIEIKNFSQDPHHRDRNRNAYNRFTNFLRRNELKYVLKKYAYSEKDMAEAKQIVINFFNARRRRGDVVGSSPEDYFALIRQKPAGRNGKDYFAYKGYLVSTNGKEYPVSFSAGERLESNKIGLYSTITLRFDELFEQYEWNMRGFTAIAKYAWLRLFVELYTKGIRVVDAGGSETVGLDTQKLQLGGRPEKTHWVVCK
jgi:hypothetical protein